MCLRHNDTARSYTPSPRVEIKFSDRAGNRTRATGLESRDSFENATETDLTIGILGPGITQEMNLFVLEGG